MPKAGSFKPFCVRGHDRKVNADSTGHCRICEKERWRPTERKNLLSNEERVAHRHNARYRFNGILNADGSPFTFQDYNRCFQIQGGCCAGCSRHQTEFKKSLLADHDHQTGIFRGLLCFQCNFVLGNVKDNPAVMLRLLNYLEKKR